MKQDPNSGTPDLFSDLLMQSIDAGKWGDAGPLANRLRPKQIEEFFGHASVLGEGKPLRQWIAADRVPSLILWGPPGCGKTTLARIVAERTQCSFVAMSAVLSGVKDLKEAVERAKETRRLTGRKTILFVDEIHRFNKSQQDALLPHVEDGSVTLIGATTENPSFELNSALLSRARVVRLESLQATDIEKIIRRALHDREKGLGGALELDDATIAILADRAQGDARLALTTLESLALSHRSLSANEIEEALASMGPGRTVRYDKSGEEHYNVVSAFIKSIRGSDPDAGLYYLARMLEGGEDPLFIARRLVILASEDVGNGDPRALQIALSVKDAVDFVGMPEARIILAQGVTYLACAPKSNASYVGINEAIEAVRETGTLPVPMHLRNAVTGLMKNEGYGKGYRYAHDFEGGKVAQQHLPDELKEQKFYRPKAIGYEKNFIK